MNASLLAHRYAHAVGELVGDPQELEKVADTINAFAELYQTDGAFRYALCNPVLDSRLRTQLADCALQGFDAPPVVTRLVHLLVQRNRADLMPDIARHIENHTAEWLNRAVVDIVTAVPLTDEMTGRIVAALGKLTGKTVIMKTKVDPDIIGGLVVYMWGVFFDFSLRTRLERLREKLLTKVDLTYES